MDDRTDPIEIIARVSEQHGKQRAFEVWRYKAEKEGWPVTVQSSSVDEPGDECGVVDVEGLRYRIRHAPRVRQRVEYVPPGRHLIAAAVDWSLGRSDGTTWTWEFDHAAWAEPVIGDDCGTSRTPHPYPHSEAGGRP
ncbi:hypothetical protein [Micromonospora sp. NPDC005806]|uniref:hypothetical protein n=1 Tax=Micromonospora sp. NPDC005806 TaxID=3364234 RepID=UPI00367B4588